ncbi:MAG: ATPase [Alphaproteobacteria bacterium]|nr:ATPase [Alphaproteobacteria bacterium]
MTAALGIDGGGRATRWVLADAAGAVLARGEAPPLSGLIFSDAAIGAARAAVAALADAAGARGGIGAVLAGVTGTSDGSPQNALLRNMLAEAFGVPQEQVRVHDDLWLAHRARFAPGTGILVYCGTGSAAVHVRADGALIRAGGHGYLIDDGGSGYAIARDAVRAVLEAEDAEPGSGWQTPLGCSLARLIGGDTWEAVRAYVYGGTRASMAALGPAVAEAARADDPAASGVLRRAGRDLAAVARVVAGRIGAQPFALAGGGATLHPLIHAAMEQALGSPVDMAACDAAAAAARIALHEI